MTSEGFAEGGVSGDGGEKVDEVGRADPVADVTPREVSSILALIASIGGGFRFCLGSLNLEVERIGDRLDTGLIHTSSSGVEAAEVSVELGGVMPSSVGKIE